MIDTIQFSPRGFFVWGICALFFLYEFFLRTVIGTFQTALMADLSLSAVQFSFLSTTLFLLVYGLMQLPVGFIIDSIGLKKSLLIGCLACSVSAFGFALSNQFLFALLFRMIMGFGASFGFIALLVSVSEWMPLRHRGLFIGLSQFIGTMGPMIAAGPLESFLSATSINWRSLFFVLSGIGVIITLLIGGLVSNNVDNSKKYITLSRKQHSIRRSLSRLFLRSQPWIIAILSTCFYFSIEYLSENEGRAFLFLKDIPISTASYMLSFSWIGYALTCPLLGWMSDRIQRRKSIIIFCAICGLLATLGVVYARNTGVLFLSFFALGLNATGQSLGFTCVAEQFKKQFMAIGFGFNNAIVMTIAAINAPLVGFVIERFKTNGADTLDSYFMAFNILIGLAIIALFFAIFLLKETFGKSQVEFTVIHPNTLKKD